MYKNILMAAAVLLAATACSNENEWSGNTQVTNEKTMVPVTVHVSDFSVSMEDMPGGATRGSGDDPAVTRATAPALTRAASAVADYDGVKAITLAFYNGATEVYKTTQLRSDNTTYTTFGEFDCSLPMGSYTMVVLGYGMGQNNEDVLTLTSPTQAEYTEGRVRETFAVTQAVNINSTNAVDISATLNRIVAKVSVSSTDNRPASVAKIRATFSGGGMAFNPTTGLATANNGFSNTVVLQNALGGTSGIVSYLFLATDEQTMDVTFETLDANDNVLYTKTITNVPLKRNRVTTLKGVMFTNSSTSGSFQVETDWLSANDPINF